MHIMRDSFSAADVNSIIYAEYHLGPFSLWSNLSMHIFLILSFIFSIILYPAIGPEVTNLEKKKKKKKKKGSTKDEIRVHCHLQRRQMQDCISFFSFFFHHKIAMFHTIIQERYKCYNPAPYHAYLMLQRYDKLGCMAPRYGTGVSLFCV